MEDHFLLDDGDEDGDDFSKAYAPLPPSSDDYSGEAAVKLRWTERVPKPHWCSCCPFDIFPVLLLTCIAFLTFGSYWSYDQPGAIKTELTEHFGEGYDSKKNLLFYSVYSFPNTVLCLFGGFIVDRITGVRGGVVMFTFLVLLGQSVFAMGVSFKEYYVALFGRFLYGLGGENLVVAQNTFTVRWFSGKVLAMAFGIVVAFARVGTSVNFIVTPKLADSGVPTAVWTSTGMTALSFTLGLCAAFIDWRGEGRRKSRNDGIKAAQDAEAGLLEQPESNGALQQEQEEAPEPEEIKLSDIKKFPLASWILFFMCLLMYVAIMTFYSVASDILQNTGNKYSSRTASTFLSIPNFMAIPFCPIFGTVQDKYGRALNFIALVFIGLIGGHVVFMLMAYDVIDIPPPVVMVWIGLCYSLGSSMIWPVLARVIDPRMLATGYGTMTSVQNCGLALFPLAIGVIQDSDGIEGTTEQYTIPIFIFIGCAVIGFLLTLWLLAVDRIRHAGRMNAPASNQTFQKELTPEEILNLESDSITAGDATGDLDVGLVSAEVPIQRLSFSAAFDDEEEEALNLEKAGSLSVSYERRKAFGL